VAYDFGSQAFTVPAAKGQPAPELLLCGTKGGINPRGLDRAGHYISESYALRGAFEAFLTVTASGKTADVWLELWYLTGTGADADQFFAVGAVSADWTYSGQSIDTATDTTATFAIPAGTEAVAIVCRGQGTAGAVTIAATSDIEGVAAGTPVTGKAIGGYKMTHNSVVLQPGDNVGGIRMGDTGAKATIVCTVYDTDGVTLGATISGWASSDTNIATIVAATGVVTPVKEGAVTFTCTTNKGFGSNYKCSIATVIKPLAAQEAEATQFNTAAFTLDGASFTPGFPAPLLNGADGSTPTLAVLPREYYSDTPISLGAYNSVVYTSSDDTIATIDPSTGVIVPLRRGNVAFTATCTRLVGLTPEVYHTSATISTGAFNRVMTVGTGAVDSVVVGFPAGSSFVEKTQTKQGLAIAYDVDGNPITLAEANTVVWSTGDNAVATVDAGTGVVTGVAEGTTELSCTVNGVQGDFSSADQQINIYVLGHAATAVVTPTGGRAMTAAAGALHTKQFNAVLYDAFGVEVTGRTIVWTSTDTGAFTINSSTGLATGVGVGTANAIATVDGHSFNSATITVS
jgi:uncharacterized protein YjdB